MTITVNVRLNGEVVAMVAAPRLDVAFRLCLWFFVTRLRDITLHYLLLIPGFM